MFVLRSNPPTPDVQATPLGRTAEPCQDRGRSPPSGVGLSPPLCGTQGQSLFEMAALDFLAAIEIGKGLRHPKQPASGGTANEIPGKRVQEGPSARADLAFVEF